MTGTANETVGQNQTVPWWMVLLEGILSTGFGILILYYPSDTFVAFGSSWMVLDFRGFFGPDRISGRVACWIQMEDWTDVGIVECGGWHVCAQPAIHKRIPNQEVTRVHSGFDAHSRRGYLCSHCKSVV